MFKLRLGLHFSLVLLSTDSKQFALMVEHLLQLLQDSLVATDFLFLCFDLLLGEEDEWRASCCQALRTLASAKLAPLHRELLLFAAAFGPTALEPLVHDTLSMAGCVHMVYVDLIIFFFLFFDDIFVESNLFSDLCVFLLLHDQLFDEEYSIVLLGLVLTLELCVFLHESTILIVDPLSYVGDELQVVVQFVLSVLHVRSLLALLRFPLFDLLLHLREFRVELPDDVFLLFFFELLCLGLNAVDVLVELLLQDCDDPLVLLRGILLKSETDSEFPLQLIDVFSVFLFSLNVTFLT